MTCGATLPSFNFTLFVGGAGRGKLLRYSNKSESIASECVVRNINVVYVIDNLKVSFYIKYVAQEAFY